MPDYIARLVTDIPRWVTYDQRPTYRAEGASRIDPEVSPLSFSPLYLRAVSGPVGRYCRCSSLQWIPPKMNPGSSWSSLKWIPIHLRLGLNGPPFIWAYTEKNPIRANKSPWQHLFITQQLPTAVLGKLLFKSNLLQLQVSSGKK